MDRASRVDPEARIAPGPGAAAASDPGAGAPFDPRATPIPRRSMLVLMGASCLGAGALATVLAGCQSPPVTVSLDLSVADLVVGTPTEVPFTVTMANGSAVEASTWLVKQADGDLISFDPRCTHALCRYTWSTDLDRFQCGCHDGRYALDGAVLAGPPPRPLDRFPVRETATGIELDIPGNFATPKASLG